MERPTFYDRCGLCEFAARRRKTKSTSSQGAPQMTIISRNNRAGMDSSGDQTWRHV